MLLELLKLLLAEIWLWSGLYFGFYSVQALYYSAKRIKDAFKRPLLQIFIQMTNAFVSLGSIGIMTWRTIQLGVFSLAPWFWVAYMAVEVIAAAIELYNTARDFEDEITNPQKKLDLLQKLFDTKVNLVAMTVMALACLLMFTPLANIFVIGIFSAVVVIVFLVKYFGRPKELPPDLALDLTHTPDTSRLPTSENLAGPSPSLAFFLQYGKAYRGLSSLDLQVGRETAFAQTAAEEADCKQASGGNLEMDSASVLVATHGSWSPASRDAYAVPDPPEESLRLLSGSTPLQKTN